MNFLNISFPIPRPHQLQCDVYIHVRIRYSTMNSTSHGKVKKKNILVKGVCLGLKLAIIHQLTLYACAIIWCHLLMHSNEKIFV